MAAKPLELCRLAVIPAYLVDAAMAACQETLEKSVGTGKTLDERKEKMLLAFREIDERIDAAVLSAKAGKDYEKLNAKDIVRLSNLYNAIKDGFVKAPVAFDFETEELPFTDEDRELEALNQAVTGGAPDA